MMKLTALKIDPEFQGKIPPLTFEEREQLEKNIVSDGKVINPIIVWKGLVVDGHNRYTILQKHPDIPYTVHEKEFADRFEAIIWICKNQLGRRNLSPEQKKYLIGKQYDAEKASYGAANGFRGNQYTDLVSNEIQYLPKEAKTCYRIAAENNVGPSYVQAAEKYATGIDLIEEIHPGMKEQILSRKVKATAAEIASVARASPEERPALVEKICISKESKKSASKSTSKSKKKKNQKPLAAVEEASCKDETPIPTIEDSPNSQKPLTELQTIRALSDKMEFVEQVADAEGMLSEVESAASTMICRLDVCFEHYPEFLKNPHIRQKVVELLQKAKEYIVKLEGEFAYD